MMIASFNREIIKDLPEIARGNFHIRETLVCNKYHQPVYFFRTKIPKFQKAVYNGNKK